MGNKQFDDRYPAMFQPGGEAVQAGAQWPVIPGATPPATPAPAAAPDAVAVGPQAPGQHSTAHDAQDALDATEPAAAELTVAGPIDSNAAADSTSAAGPAAAARSTRFLWRVPAVVGALFLGAGVMVAVLPLWTAMSKGDAEALNSAQMWGYTAAQASAPMIGIGLGILAMVLFVYVHQHPTRREGLRRLYAIATGAVMAAGMFAQFSTYIFRPVPLKSVDSVSGEIYTFSSSPVFVTSLMLVAFGPLLVGFLMLAALAVSRNFSRIRMCFVGLALMAAAAFSQFAQKIFPNVPPTRQTFEGGIEDIPGWPSWLPLLMPALVAAGVIVIASVALGPVVAAAIRAPRAVQKTDLLDGESKTVEQEEDHVRPEL